MTDGRIKDSEITAYGTHGSYYPHYARLNETDRNWLASTGTGRWIQVAFSSPVKISGMMMRGDDRDNYWITTFNVQYADDEGKLKYVEDSNGVKIFSGNTDHHNVRTNFFDEVLTTSIIRILPITYVGSYIALRMELLTPTDLDRDEGKNLPPGAICRFKKSETANSTCNDYYGDCGIGMADGRITNNQITASTYYNSAYYPYYGRLTREFDGWRPKHAQPNSWIQIEMTKAMNISGVMTRGGGHYSQWITAFKIQYGNSTNALKTIQDEYGDKLFPGNWDYQSIRTTYFDTIITAKYLRLLVIYGKNDVATYSNTMRMEILTPTNLMSDVARALPDGAVCQYESHRFQATANDHALMIV